MRSPDRKLRKFVLSRDDYTCQNCGYVPPIHTLSEYHDDIKRIDEKEQNGSLYGFFCIRDRILQNEYTVVVKNINPYTTLDEIIYEWYYDEKLEIDHIIPVHLEGETEPENLQTLCKKCHSKKTAKELWNLERVRFREYMQSLGVGVEA